MIKVIQNDNLEKTYVVVKTYKHKPYFYRTYYRSCTKVYSRATTYKNIEDALKTANEQNRYKRRVKFTVEPITKYCVNLWSVNLPGYNSYRNEIEIRSHVSSIEDATKQQYSWHKSFLDIESAIDDVKKEYNKEKKETLTSFDEKIQLLIKQKNVYSKVMEELNGFNVEEFKKEYVSKGTEALSLLFNKD